MKRITALAVLLILVLGCGMSAAAASQTHRVEELGLSIDIPTDWITVSVEEEVPADDLAILGVTSSEELIATMKQRGIYVNAISVTPFSEIIVASQETDSSLAVYDFSRYTDEELNEVAKEMMAETTAADYSDVRVLKHSQVTFLVFDLRQTIDGDTVDGVQYYTVVNGRTLSITLNSYSGAITEAQSKTLTQVVDSLTLDEVKPVPEGPTLWMILGGAAALIVVVTVVFVFVQKRK